MAFATENFNRDRVLKATGEQEVIYHTRANNGRYRLVATPVRYHAKYRIYSNRGRPQIEAYSNKSRIFRASPSDLNDLFFENSSKLGHLGHFGMS